MSTAKKLPRNSARSGKEKFNEHLPVLVGQVIDLLAVAPGKHFIDATVGGGGHAEAILKAGGSLFGIDIDPEAIEITRKRLVTACPPSAFTWVLKRGNFAHLDRLSTESRFLPVDGILFDLGLSSIQLASDRGFAFGHDSLLDMRMDPDLGVTAADLLKVLSENELYQIFTKFSQERRARAIARALVGARRVKPIETTGELAALVERVYRGQKVGRLHPATRVFATLRIVVNNELGNLEKALLQTVNILKPGGRLVVISFHSGEDRIVKNFFKRGKREGVFKLLTKKPVRPGEDEFSKNPRARSARLRAAEKI